MRRTLCLFLTALMLLCLLPLTALGEEIPSGEPTPSSTAAPTDVPEDTVQPTEVPAETPKPS